jgi:hypothetical protein
LLGKVLPALLLLVSASLTACSQATEPAEPAIDRYAPLSLAADGDTARLYGSIKSESPEVVAAFLGAHPATRTLAFVDMPGSSDDAAALEIARLIRAAGLNTHMPSDARIESGAVMVFVAGVERTAECGALAGVHAWWDTAGYSAQEVPPDHPGHAHFIEYYAQMGLPDTYYWFTVNAAPPDAMHTLSAPEMNAYGLLTSEIDCEDI